MRLSRLTDYGILLMAHFAKMGKASYTARELSLCSGIPLPTVSKVLKSLTRKELIFSQRGAKGGYSLARSPESISVADVVAAIEGPVAITQCAEKGAARCELEASCLAKAPLNNVNNMIVQAMSRMTLADVALRNGVMS
jgi:FeS assembly SUF system regulator